MVSQGDVLKIEKIKQPVLVTSTNYFNETGEIIGCPVYSEGIEGALHIAVDIKGKKGLVHCEKVTLIDLTVRGYSKINQIAMKDIINITDAVQSIFDHI